MRSRIPVYWENIVIKAGEATAGISPYGCVTSGKLVDIGSGSVVQADYRQQVIDLLNSDPLAFTGTFAESFDAFDKLIKEIESTLPTPEQVQKLKNVGGVVQTAVDKWVELLDNMLAKNPANSTQITNIKTILLSHKSAIGLALSNPVTANLATSLQPIASDLQKKYQQASSLEKILNAVKGAYQAGQRTVDLTEFYRNFGFDVGVDGIHSQGIIGTTLPIHLDQPYYPNQFSGATLDISGKYIFNLDDLFLDDNQEKIGGLNIQGNKNDILAIWKWLGVEDSRIQKIENLAETDTDTFDILKHFPPTTLATAVALPMEAAWISEFLSGLASTNYLRLLGSASVASLPFILVGDTNPWKDFTLDLPAFQGGGIMTYKLPRYLTKDEIDRILGALATADILHRLNSGEPTRLYKIIVLRSGNYECSHCLGGTTYLEEGNIYKYGVSYDRLEDERYSGESGYVNQQITSRNMRRIDLVTLPSRSVALAIEKMLIVGYMINPENLDRPKKGYPWLIRPAGNKIYR